MPAGPLVPAPVQRLIDAINAGDSPGFLNCFTEDGVVDDWEREFTGQEAIAAWDEAENIGAHSQIAIEGAQTDGDEVTLDIDVSGDGYNGGGSFTFVVRGNLISRMTIRG